jgi:hypothetical protein
MLRSRILFFEFFLAMHFGFFADMRTGSFVWCCLILLALLGSPAMRSLWLDSHFAGNANLLFNLQLVLIVAAGSLVADYTASQLSVFRRMRALAKATAS